MKTNMIYGLVQEESEQGLGKLVLNNYPHSQQKLESQLSSKPKPQQTTYSKSRWHRFIDKELQKLHQYDYDITFQRCPDISASKYSKKYKKVATVVYQCQCGQKWENRYQKVVFSFQLRSQASYIEELQRKTKQMNLLEDKSLKFGKSVAQELKNLIDLTIYPYFLKYQLTIDEKKCGKCKKMAAAHLHKSKISTLSKLFCQQICQILSKQGSNLHSVDQKVDNKKQ